MSERSHEGQDPEGKHEPGPAWRKASRWEGQEERPQPNPLRARDEQAHAFVGLASEEQETNAPGQEGYHDIQSDKVDGIAAQGEV